MPFKVIKFGGSNLQSSGDLSRCATIVKSYNVPCVIVVSAFFQVTDDLKRAAHQASDTGSFPGNYIDEFSSLCYERLNANVSDAKLLRQTQAELQKMLDKLAHLLKGIYAISELPPAIHDTVLSFGERISALIFTAVLKSRNLKASLRLPEDFGLITTGEFGSASILLKDSANMLNGYFKEDQYYVVPGFYGVSAEGKTTLLGRGGTDYSAAALAYFLNAESLDVWKDADGFQTADPKIVNNPQTIDYLSYNEAAELSYFGAKILHPRTVEPLELKNIPIRIFNILTPDEGARSVIGSEAGDESSGPKSITFSRNFSVIKFKGPGVGIKPGVLARIAGIMDSAGVNISSVFTSQTAICFLLQSSDLDKSVKAVEAGSPELISDIETISDIALVALVGEGITKKRGIAARAFQAVAEENINVEIIAAGASTAAVYFVVKEKDCAKSVEATHRYFFTDSAKSYPHLHSDLTSSVL